MTFIERLKELMQGKSVSKQDLTQYLHIGKNQIKYWEDNGNIPDGTTLIKIADYFGVSVDYLLGKAEKKQVTPEEQPVTGIEKELLELTADMDDDEKMAVLGYAARLVAKHKKED